MTSASLPIPEREPEELDPRVLHQFRRQKQTLEDGAFEPVITIASEWVERHPDVPAFRHLLREAQMRKHCKPSIPTSKSSPLLTGLIGMKLRSPKDPFLILAKCEKTLQNDPLNIPANQTLAETATTLGWTQTARLGWQTLLLNPHREVRHVLAFGKYLLDQQKNEEVLQLCDSLLKAFPNDATLSELRVQAAIRQSIHSAGE